MDFSVVIVSPEMVERVPIALAEALPVQRMLGTCTLGRYVTRCRHTRK